MKGAGTVIFPYLSLIVTPDIVGKIGGSPRRNHVGDSAIDADDIFGGPPCLVPGFSMENHPFAMENQEFSMENHQFDRSMMLHPIGSMYAIYGNIYHHYPPNVSIYIHTIHGSYGHYITSRSARVAAGARPSVPNGQAESAPSSLVRHAGGSLKTNEGLVEEATLEVHACRIYYIHMFNYFHILYA